MAPQGLLFALELVAYALALAPCVPVVHALVNLLGPWSGYPLGLAVSFHLAAIVLVCVVGLLRKAVGGTVPPGRYPLDSAEARTWIRNMGICEIVRRSPFYGFIRHYPFFTVFFYRLMGARIAWDVRIGDGARITDPWLTHMGDRINVGDYSLVLGHFIEGNTLHLAPVTLERESTIGVEAVLTPGCCVGPGSTLAANAFLPKGKTIPAGETWAGTPAKKLETEQSGKAKDPSASGR